MLLSRRVRIILLVLGFFLLLYGLSAILYAIWPLPDASFSGTIPATLLAPP